MSTAHGSQRLPLTRNIIAVEAMELLHEVGPEKLTMRALASRLNVSAMALYHHVEDREELLRLIGDELLGRIELPNPDSAPWRKLVTLTVNESVDALESVPGLSAVLLSSKLLPNATKILLFAMHQFERAGLTKPKARIAYAGLQQLVLGRLVVQERMGPPGAARSELSKYIAVLHGRAGFDTAVRALLDQY